MIRRINMAHSLHKLVGMKKILRTSTLAFLITAATLSSPLMADETASSPTTPAPGGTPASTDSKTQENTPAGPANQGATGTTGTPQQTKTGDTATTDKPLSNGAPNQATKRPKHKKKHHHTTSQESSQTNVAPATSNP
jgi:hypothetical protein